jgi:predicted RecB family nuclease
VGVIDLVLRQGDQVIVIDHKTGRDFYPQDVLQMAIYREWVQRQYPAARYSFYYDNYRWVRNLQRIRKPAFQRLEVEVAPDFWSSALERIRRGQKQIDRILDSGEARKNGECFRCPYRSQCW